MAANLLKRFPDTKEEAMKEKFPLVKWSELTRSVRNLLTFLNISLTAFHPARRYSCSLGHHRNLNVDFGKMVRGPRYMY